MILSDVRSHSPIDVSVTSQRKLFLSNTAVRASDIARWTYVTYNFYSDM
jgi:hypothetical protein